MIAGLFFFFFLFVCSTMPAASDTCGLPDPAARWSSWVWANVSRVDWTWANKGIEATTVNGFKIAGAGRSPLSPLGLDPNKPELGLEL